MSKNVNVEVVRAFALAGERQEVGDVVEVPAALAAELKANGKAAPTDKKAGKAKKKPVKADSSAAPEPEQSAAEGEAA